MNRSVLNLKCVSQLGKHHAMRAGERHGGDLGGSPRQQSSEPGPTNPGFELRRK